MEREGLKMSLGHVSELGRPKTKLEIVDVPAFEDAQLSWLLENVTPQHADASMNKIETEMLELEAALNSTKQQASAVLAPQQLAPSIPPVVRKEPAALPVPQRKLSLQESCQVRDLSPGGSMLFDEIAAAAAGGGANRKPWEGESRQKVLLQESRPSRDSSPDDSFFPFECADGGIRKPGMSKAQRNREAARKCRLKKKLQMSSLTSGYDRLAAENRYLKSILARVYTGEDRQSLLPELEQVLRSGQL
eukprot:CAMPEP_0185848948 /NCGR_PEP_ID=MMETSP1354-20130828/3636_1 /TAXON_ID=708628 /ORGANISM="Erythrolobus madagascarensis, Strain CCMP3276" /LENGTH=247 /DNA_ID=CAMNT_0028549411 /DNA_START=40 /DNA_END=783 /DNA_ORIENTATION=-